MTNLLRLADSPLLLDGLEEFVSNWLGNSQASPVPTPSTSDALWLNHFPETVHQYWEMIHRWPDAYLGGSQDSFAGTSQWRKQLDPNNVSLILENQGCWTIYWKLSEEQLWVDDDTNDVRLPCSLPHFLVTFGLYELVMGFLHETHLDSEPVPVSLKNQGRKIWEGVYNAPDHHFEFWHISEPRVLWWTDSHGFTFFGTRNENAANWLDRHFDD